MGEVENHDTNSSTRQAFRKKLREGQLDDKEIEIDVSAGRVNGGGNHGTSRHGRNDQSVAIYVPKPWFG